MEWSYSSIIFPLFLMAITGSSLAFYALQRRHSPGALPLALLFLAASVWSLAYAFELIYKVEAIQILWLKIKYIGVAIVPLAWFLFSFQYSNRARWINRRWMILLGGEALFFLVLVWTNQIHGLVWQTFRQLQEADFIILKPVYGPILWFQLFFSYLLILIGVYQLIRRIGHKPLPYRKRDFFILAFLSAPVWANILTVTRLGPIYNLDMTPYGFLITCAVVLWGIIHFRFLEIIPLAQKAIIEGMGDGLLLLDSKNRVVYLNQTACAALGRPPGDLIGKPFDQILPYSQVLQSIAFETKVEWTSDSPPIQKEIVLEVENSHQYFELHVSSLAGINGAYFGQSVVWRDITQRRIAEHKLREEHAQLQMLTSQAPAILWTTDNQLCFTSLAGASLNTLDLQPDQVVGITIEEFVQTDDPSHLMLEAHRRALQGHTSIYEAVMRDSTFQYHLEPLRDGSGAVIGVVGVALDITVRKQAELASKRSQQQLAQVVENSPNPIFSVDRQGIIQTWSPACVNTFHYGVDRIGLNFHDLLANPDEQPMFDEMLKQVFETKNAFSNVEVAFRSNEGVERHTSSRLYPLLDQLGNVEVCVFASTDITERMQADQALRRQLEEMTVLHKVAAACIEADDEDVLIERVSQVIGSEFYLDNFGVILVDEKSGLLSRHSSYHQDVTIQDNAYPIGSGITGLVALDGRPRRIGDVSTEPAYWKIDPQTCSELCVPLKAGERVIGVVNAESRLLDDFTPTDERLLTILASQLAIAIEKLRAKAAERQRIQELIAIARVSREVSADLDRQHVLNSIVRLAAEISHSDASGLFARHADGYLYLVASYGVGEEFVREVNKHGTPLEGTVVGIAVTARKPFQIPDFFKEPTYSTPKIAELENLRAALALPLVRGDEVIGGIVIWQRQPRFFTTEEEVFLQTLANQSVNAVENARLFEVEREQRKIAEVLRETGTVLSATLEFDRVLDRMLDQLARLVPYDAACVMWVEDGWARVVRQRGYDQFGENFAQKIGALTLEIAKTENLRRMFDSGQPLVIPDTSLFPLWIPISEKFFLRSWAGAPLIIQDQVVAFFSLDKIAPDFYRPDYIQPLEIFSSQSALSLHNARLFEETRRRAVQQEAINHIISAAVAAPDLMDLEETVLDLTLRAVRADKGGLWVSGHAVLRGLPPEIGAASLEMARSATIDNNDISIVSDWQKIEPDDPQARWKDHMSRFGVQASIYIPVSGGGKRIGVLSLASTTPREWLPEEIDLAAAVGRQIGGAVERLDLIAKTREQARQVQQIVDTVPEGVLLLDTDRRVVLANPAAQRYLPLMAVEAGLDKPLLHLAGQPVEDFLKFSPKEPYRELQIENPSPHTFEIAARPLELEVQDSGWVLVLRDITLERENQAKVQMQDRLATVGQLAAGIAHDFNNIMAAVVVYTDLLSIEPSLPHSSREQVMIIQDQILRATSLIRQILDFSRRSVMEQSALDMLPFIKELDKLLVRVLPENIRLDLNYQPGIFTVKADPTRLQQALMNLVLNARDAMPDGGVLQFSLDRFNLAAEQPPPFPDLAPGNWIRLAVKDNGVGISSDVLPYIFDPFFTTKPVGKGTGLGLAQVYGIVKQHGGSIDVHSNLGVGTEFDIYLREFDLAEEKPDPILSPVRMMGTGETVLLVEDDRAALDALQSLLESQNYRVLVSRNGIEALRLFNREQASIAMVISDVVMPETGGVELFHLIYENHPNIKMLLITGHPMDVASQVLLEAGRVQWLQKPFSVQEFSSTLRMMLDNTS